MYDNMTKASVKEIYGKMINVLVNKSVKARKVEIPRFEENYSYQILDNFNIDEVEDYILRRVKGNNSSVVLTELREITKDYEIEYELKDSLYSTVRRCVSHDGTRRSRSGTTDSKGSIKTELIELNLNSLVPDVIYLLNQTDFYKEDYREQFTEEEYKDMNNIFIALMSRTISAGEKKRLTKYFLRDSITERFFRSTQETMKLDANIEYRHPNPFKIELFEDIIITVADEFDVIRYYVKSILLPILIEMLNRIQNHNMNNDKKYKMLIRSISEYRIILERDIGCSLSLKYSNGGYIVSEPEVTILKTTYRTKKEALEEIEEVTRDDLEDMLNGQFGGIRTMKILNSISEDNPEDGGNLGQAEDYLSGIDIEEVRRQKIHEDELRIQHEEALKLNELRELENIQNETDEINKEIERMKSDLVDEKE